jgi:hypothetical protein
MAEAIEPAQIIVEALPHPGRVRLLVKYADKEGHIELPVGEPLHDREPAVYAYRRELLEMLTAIDEWAQLHEEPSWPQPPKT